MMWAQINVAYSIYLHCFFTANLNQTKMSSFLISKPIKGAPGEKWHDGGCESHSDP